RTAAVAIWPSHRGGSPHTFASGTCSAFERLYPRLLHDDLDPSITSAAGLLGIAGHRCKRGNTLGSQAGCIDAMGSPQGVDHSLRPRLRKRDVRVERTLIVSVAHHV